MAAQAGAAEGGQVNPYKRHLPSSTDIHSMHVAINRIWDAIEAANPVTSTSQSARTGGASPSVAPIVGGGATGPTGPAGPAGPTGPAGTSTSADLLTTLSEREELIVDESGSIVHDEDGFAVTDTHVEPELVYDENLDVVTSE